MASGIFGVALSGLNAAQIGMQTTGHNISNVNTTGYSRQQIEQSQGSGQFTGAGFIGGGSDVTSIRRVYADYLLTQAQALQAQSAESSAHATELGRLSGLLSDPNANLGAALDDFFSSVEGLAANPADPVARQGLLSGAQAVAGRFKAADAALADMQTRADGQIRTSVDLINGYSQSIAVLNGAIANAQGSGQPPNDLLDQRDALIAKLNGQVRAVVVQDGAVNLFLTNGQPLVLGNTAIKLVLMRDDLNASKLALGAFNGSTIQMLRQSDISGGVLGGMLAFRDQTLQPVRNEIGRLAMTLAAGFNDQHRLGQDRNGLPGGTFFNVAVPLVNGSTNNTGTASLTATVSSYSGLTASDYQVDYDGINYTVTRLSDRVQATYATLPQTLDGLTIAVAAGTAAAGDRFLIQPTRAGATGMSVAISNVSQIAASAPVRSASSVANAGDGVIAAGSVNSLGASLLQPVTITFTSASTFNVGGVGTGNPAGVAYTAGGAISYNGWAVSISGTPKVGDVFTVGPNTGATGDNRNALALAGLSQAALVAGMSVSGAYAHLVGSIGAKTQEINMAMKSQDSLLESANNSIASISGVNLDEEAANLMRYQQAYQAAGKLISVASTLFDSLLHAVN